MSTSELHDVCMKIRILTIGQKMPAWVLTGFEDYFKRIQPFVQTQIIELPMAKRGKNDSEADILKYRNIEGDSILNALKSNETLIALEVGGREFSTEKLAETMKGWMLEGNDVALAIGGRMVILKRYVRQLHGTGHYPN